MPKYHLILVAGGKGLRMGSETAKQFLLLHGKPLIVHTLERFLHAMPELRVIVALPKAHIEQWQEIRKAYLPHSNMIVTKGGKERFHSVQTGLDQVNGQPGDIVGVHDAVRPFVAGAVIQNCYRSAAQFGAAIPVAPLHESLRQVDGQGNNKAVVRDHFRKVQTPQCFELSLLQRAFQQPYSSAFTDDASVVEATGQYIHLVEGNKENLKITSPLDWEFAKVLIKKTHEGQ